MNCRQLTLLVLVFLSWFPQSEAQEITYQITIASPKSQNVDPKIYRSMESMLKDWLGNHRWTRETFEVRERINCNIQITIKEEINDNTFSADLIIQASRPVYGTVYETPILNHMDPDFTFQFEESRPLQYSENVFSDNLTHVLAFYSHLILGLDYDSFSLYGGEKFLQTAQEILNTVPINDLGARGWRANDGNRTRYWMIENLINPRLRPFRKLFYNYHRLGLDVMHKDPEKGRSVILEALEELEKLNVLVPNAAMFFAFFAAKNSELLDVFIVAPSAEKQKVFGIVTKIDPTSGARLAELRR
jgi:uncharacterized protein YggT (Ycf19 family)